MQTILTIVLPVFAILAAGWLSVATGLLSQDTGDALSRFVYVVAIPLLLFETMATGRFDAGGAAWLWTAYFGGVAVVWLTAFQILKRLFGRDNRASVIGGVAASFANTVLVALPLVERAYGPELLQVLFLIISIHLPVMTFVSTLLVEHAAARDTGAPFSARAVAIRVGRNLATNAIVIGLFAGVAWRLSALPFDGPHGEAIDLIGRTAGPLALFSLGMSLTRYGVSANIAQASVISVMSLVMLPAAVLAIGSMLPGLPEDWLRVAVITAACPTGVNAYIFATHFRTAEGLATNVILFTTVASVATVTVWLEILSRL